ncbi:MAG: acyl carrier protein [Erythrobacter sp.]|uniref:acyl carrier protein n=1 Tax=Erythrobacter sp. TaxID=1042 RepID=UPI003C7495F1
MKTGQASSTDPAGDVEDTGLTISRAELDGKLKAIIADVLAIESERAETLEADSGLFGHLPELDSMAVATLLTEMEDRLDIVIEDEDVDGEMLETYGGLLAFSEAKLVESQKS